MSIETLIQEIAAVRQGLTSANAITLDPSSAAVIAPEFVHELHRRNLQHICGIDNDAIPIVAQIVLYNSLLNRLPITGCYLRREAKKYGTKALLDGHASGPTATCAIAGTIHDPHEALEALDRLKASNLEVPGLIALIDGGTGTQQMLEAAGYFFKDFESLLSKEE